MRRLIVATVLAAGAVLSTAGAASASAPVTETGIEVENPSAAAARCYGIRLVNPSRWEGHCRVYSGQLRSITYCSNGRVSYGAWVPARPAPWFVYGNCPGARVTRIVFQHR